MPNSEDITIWFEAEKLRALRKALKQTGSDVEQELTKTLEALYEQSVPLHQRTAIACRIVEEKKRTQEEGAIQAAERYRVSIVRVIDREIDHCWKIEKSLDVLFIATYLREAMRRSSKQIADYFEQRLREKESITPDEVNRFIAARSQGDIHVSGIFSVDIKNQVFTFVDDGGHLRQYHMKDISTATFHANRNRYISEHERMRRFETYLENKQIEGDD